MQPQALRLSRITISNLRSIQRETFPLSDFTALIGYNNAGKTNILMGIRWLLANFSLDISYFDDPNHPVEAEGLFEGVRNTGLLLAADIGRLRIGRRGGCSAERRGR